MRITSRLKATAAALVLAATLAGLGASPAGAAPARNGVINGYGAGWLFNVDCEGSHVYLDAYMTRGAGTTGGAFRLIFLSVSQNRWSNWSNWVAPANYVGNSTYRYGTDWYFPQWNIPQMGTGRYRIYAEFTFRDRYGYWRTEGNYINDVFSSYGGTTGRGIYCYSLQSGW
jgi:hypothetical protein